MRHMYQCQCLEMAKTNLFPLKVSKVATEDRFVLFKIRQNRTTSGSMHTMAYWFHKVINAICYLYWEPKYESE
jgi:hypothetical protein